MIRIFHLVLFSAIAALLCSSTALADTIGGPGSSCATCDGAAYTLTYSGSPISTTSNTQTFQITLDVNDSSYTGGGSFLNATAIKVDAPSHLDSASLVSAPSGFSYMAGLGLDANGCHGGSGGFLCSESSTNGVSVLGGPYDFVYDVTVDTGTLFTGTNAASIKARYVDANGSKVGALLSENITLQVASVPEPASILVFAVGLAGVGLFRKKLIAARRAM